MTKISKKQYIKNLNNGFYKNQRQEVYNLIKAGSNTIEKLSLFMGEKHRFSGRLTELEECGAIKPVNIMGKFSFYKICETPKEQKETRKLFKQKIFMKWINKAEYFENLVPDLKRKVLELM